LAEAGKRLVLAGPKNAVTLLDSVTGRQQKRAWPSILYGLDEPKADYRGRLVALAFADPAWQGGAHQAMDVWLLDTWTGRLQTETCLRLSLVNGSRFHPLQRSRSFIPASCAIRSSSEGHA
jgi:hypothetical protein